MSSMFESSTNFGQNIGLWNTSSVKDMSFMFRYVINFNQNIGGWNTSSVTDMRHMFYASTNSNFNQNIGNWNTTKVINMSSMFKNATSFNNGALGGVLSPLYNAFYWNTKIVVSMSSMFTGATSFNQHIGTFNLTSCGDNSSMVVGATAFIAASLTNKPQSLTNGTVLSRSALSFTLPAITYTTDELNASKPTGVSATKSGTNLTINFTTPS